MTCRILLTFWHGSYAIGHYSKLVPYKSSSFRDATVRDAQSHEVGWWWRH